MKDVVETYESLHEFKVKQDRLIAEGKIQKPQIVYGFSPEGRRIFNNGLTFEQLWNKVEQNLAQYDS